MFRLKVINCIGEMTMNIVFWLSGIFIVYTFIGYPLSLFLLDKIYKEKSEPDLDRERPSISIIVPAHNEEMVIGNKLKNLMELNYDQKNREIIIASDNSTDLTNAIVRDVIKSNPDQQIRLHEVQERKGKMNALNEAARTAKGEILVFTDANAMLDKDAAVHLVSSFTSDDIIYVTGRLQYVNSFDSLSSGAESNYWNYDLFMRKVESKVKTVTSGNGAIYAIKKNEYVEFDPINSHDGTMPLYSALQKKRAIYNEKAVAYEKAGTKSGDEFKRKVRMFRGGLKPLYAHPKKYNVFQYGWFSYFYFWHRACRRGLFVFHIALFLSNLFLVNQHPFFAAAFLLQVGFYGAALLKKFFGVRGRVFYYPYYYCMTLLAQLIGSYNQITGKSKPFWEKAETTR